MKWAKKEKNIMRNRMKTKNKVSSSVGDRNKRVRNSDQGTASQRCFLAITLMVQPFVSLPMSWLSMWHW